MPHTRLLFRNAAREKVLRGATQLTEIPGKHEHDHEQPMPGME